MAVYTKLNKGSIEEILSNYNLGMLDTFQGIEEGIENTNYFLSINKKKFILTIYEKRVKSNELPFFSDLMTHLNKAGFKCPVPIINNQKKTITKFEDKNLMLVSFLEGKSKQNLSPDNCKSIGIEVARMHKLTKNFKLKRRNNLSIQSWRGMFDSVKDQCSKLHTDLPKLIEENLKDVEKNWPHDLPRGIIHADLFHDNIFFLKDNLSGIIDFYFSCEDRKHTQTCSRVNRTGTPAFGRSSPIWCTNRRCRHHRNRTPQFRVRHHCSVHKPHFRRVHRKSCAAPR